MIIDYQRAHSFKTKILLCVLAVLSFVVIVSVGITYQYYRSILLQDLIENEKTLLQREVQRIENFIDDIYKTTNHVIINEDIQQILIIENNHGVSNYSVYRYMTIIQDAMDFLLSVQRLVIYIDGIHLAANTDIAYYVTSLYNSVNLKYYKEKYQSKQYTAFKNEDIDNTLYLSNDGQTIDFFRQIRNMNRPDEVLGTLIVKLKYQYLYELMNESKALFNSCTLLSPEAILYHQGDSIENTPELNTIFQELQEKYQETEKGEPIKTSTGYLLYDKIDGTDWIISVFTSTRDLMGRINYVLLYSLLLLSMMLPIGTLVIFLVLKKIFNPLSQLTEAMQEISKGNLNHKIIINSNDEIEAMADTFNSMTVSLNEYSEQSIQNEKLKKELEFDLLLSQINPHFIYNILNSIVYMARKRGNTDIEEMTVSFISLLQNSLDVTTSGMMLSLEREVENLKHYIKIQEFRYKELFSIIYSIDESILSIPVPRSILQPFVENSIFHGIHQNSKKGEIFISIQKQSSSLLIIIRDNGVGIPQQKVQSLLHGEMVPREGNGGLRSIGVINIRNRLEFVYGSGASLNIHSEVGEGTQIIIKIDLQ